MRAALLAIASLAACVELPDVASETAGPWPALVPLAPIVAAAEVPASDPAPALDTRAEALRARAAALRRSRLPEADRARLEEAAGRG